MNSQTTARTAGPWHTEIGSFGYVVDADGDTVALCEESGEGSQGDANAAFIVQACNAHDELVAALNGLLDRYTSLVNCGDCGFWEPEGEPQVIAARAALKKAGA